MTTRAWHAFTAHNAQTVYGCGTAAEADAYADQINAARQTGHYHAQQMTDDEVAELGLETTPDLGFDLSDALSDEAPY